MENKFLKNFFLGTYPADVIPEKIKSPCCWIWNTDTQNESGKHWVFVWLPKKKMFFFDSFGKTVSFYSREYWVGLAKKLNVKFTYVQQYQIQSKITYTCGSWCLLYLYMKSKNIKNINKKIKFTKNDKIKLKNDIKFKKKMLDTFGEVFKTIYTKKCKQSNKKKFQKTIFKNFFYLYIIYYSFFIWEYICSNTCVFITTSTIIK